MAVKPFANAPHAAKSAIATSWLIGVQAGNTPNAVSEMKYLTVGEFTEYVRSNYGSMWNYRGECSNATPTDPVNNDYFLAVSTFAEDGTIYTANHLYAYNGNTWDDVSNVLNQYARQSALDQTNVAVAALEDRADTDESNITSLDERVTTLEQAAQSGYNYKGDCTYANLPTSGQQLGDMWYVTDRNDNYIWNGSVWRAQNNVGWAWVLQSDGNYKLGLLEH